LNEDAFLADDARALYAVADGLGGHPGGGTASHVVVESVAAALRARPDVTHDQAKRRLLAAFESAANEIDERVRKNPTLRGMASTLTAVLVREGKATIAHVGDSRAYLLRERRIEQLTRDHSLAFELYESGAIERDQIASHYGQHILTRAIGSKTEPL